MRNKVNDLLEKYFSSLVVHYKKDQIPFSFYSELLILLVDKPEYTKNYFDVEETGYIISNKIKLLLETQGANEIGMLTGLGKDAFAIYLYSTRTNNLKNLSSSINTLLLERASEELQKIIKVPHYTYANEYDIIRGLSGVLYYLLNFDWKGECKVKLNRIINYLISLTVEMDYKGKKLNHFFIPKEHFPNPNDKIKYPSGYLNFSLAHGMLGPLIALCKAKKNNYCTFGLDKAINRIFSIYDTFKIDTIFWPGCLSPEEFINNNISVDWRFSRSSWCYGNIGITRGLYIASQYIQHNERMHQYENSLKKAILRPIEDYRLTGLSMCHGLSSVLSVCSCTYWETKNEQLKKRSYEIIERCYDILKEDCIFKNGDYDESSEMAKYFDRNPSILQGLEGVVLSTLNTLYSDLDFGALFMIR